MDEQWDGLSRETFTGTGSLTCRRANFTLPSSIRLVQLFNGRIWFEISTQERNDTFSPFKIRSCEFAGTLDDGRVLTVKGIEDFGRKFSPFGNDLVMSGFLPVGYFEIAQPEHPEEPSFRKIYCDLTNLPLDGRGPIQVASKQAQIQLEQLPDYEHVLQLMKALRIGGVLCRIGITFSKPVTERRREEFTRDLCDLLSLAERSYVWCVSQHWENADGVIVRSRYEEPKFHYSKFPRSLISTGNLTLFIQDTIDNYEMQRSTWKLFWALDYYLQTMSLNSAWSQALGFFTALETLKQAFLDQSGRKERPAYKIILKEMFRELKMEVGDDELKQLVELRNQIIHTGSPDFAKGPWNDATSAFRRACEFGGLVERTILTILKYQGKFEPYDQSFSF